MCKTFDTVSWDRINRLIVWYNEEYWCSDGLKEKIATLTEEEKVVIKKTYDLVDN